MPKYTPTQRPTDPQQTQLERRRAAQQAVQDQAIQDLVKKIRITSVKLLEKNSAAQRKK